MKARSLALTLLSLFLALLTILTALPARGQTPPYVPIARFYGSVTVGGYAAPPSTSITAQGANGAFCGSGSVDGSGWYDVDIQPSSPCSSLITFFVNGQPADQPGILANSLSGAVALNLTVSNPFFAAYGLPVPPPLYAPTGSVTYQSGWNLVAGSGGAVLSNAGGQLFTFQPGDSGYETISSSSSLQAGYGYWALFSSTTTINISVTTVHAVRRPIPAGQHALIGNPFNQVATISGASKVYTYDPVRGYQATTTLQPGQGAWVTSAAGMVVITTQ
jgi:hypothetical protein